MAYTMFDDAAYEVQRKIKRENRRVFFENAKTFHHRLMMRYLRKRGWVVFYLENEHRGCKGLCWLNLYQSEKDK